MAAAAAAAAVGAGGEGSGSVVAAAVRDEDEGVASQAAVVRELNAVAAGAGDTAVGAAVRMLASYVACEWPEAGDIARAPQVARDLVAAEHAAATLLEDSIARLAEAGAARDAAVAAVATAVDATAASLSESALGARVAALETALTNMSHRMVRLAEATSTARTDAMECKARCTRLEADNVALKERLVGLQYSASMASTSSEGGAGAPGGAAAGAVSAAAAAGAAEEAPSTLVKRR